MRDIVIVAHNLRSCHNVGSILRTADGLGITEVYFTGYTPYPTTKNDGRLPHVSKKIHKQIQKTALGAENVVKWNHSDNIYQTLKYLKQNNFEVIALEQHANSTKINTWKPPKKVAIVLGRETEGIEKSVLLKCDEIIEIPMFGKKESFNVVQAAAMIMYDLRFTK